jgi:hypothetical protein
MTKKEKQKYEKIVQLKSNRETLDILSNKKEISAIGM